MHTIDMSPIGLFLAAGLVGRTVFVLLVASSIWCWVVAIEVWLGLRRLDRAIADGGGDREPGLLAEIRRAGEEAARLVVASEDFAARRVRVAEAMTRGAEDVTGRIESGLPSLAMISSTAPFVGLFGTVWGIMSSFMGIAQAQDTSLAVVAPGIAEALAATAVGLVAAIPASIAYNHQAFTLGLVGRRLHHRIEADAVHIALPPATPRT